jgi:hypothetical protein
VKIQSATKEYVKVAVVDEIADVDPTSGTVDWCFVPASADATAATDWTSLTALTGAVTAAGSWQTADGLHYVRCLVSGASGGGAAELADGEWLTFVRVSAIGSETPVLDLGLLVVD